MEYKAEWKKIERKSSNFPNPNPFPYNRWWLCRHQVFSRSFRENFRRIACADKSCMNDLFVTTMEN